jgi:hypothetical protein
MKGTIASWLDRIRGSRSSDESDIVKQSCLETAGEPPVTKARPITLSYPIAVRNIGELVSPIAVQFATGRPTVWKPRPAGEHLLGPGSILHWATPLSDVWGTGLMNPEVGVGELDGERVWALRGKLTYGCLKPEISGLQDVPLGDPAYLVGRRLAALVPSRSTTHRLGIVPRLQDNMHPAIAYLKNQGGVMVLDVRDPAPAFFARIMACDAIASSSLYGLIFAEALGIPNVWLHFEDVDANGAFKYWDWFSLADKPETAPLRIGLKSQARTLAAAATLHDVRIDERALRNAVPRAVLDELSVPARKAPRIVHFLDCRRHPMPIFLSCGDLGQRLQGIAAAYGKQSMATELILIDGGAGGGETQAAISRLQQQGAQVRAIDPGTAEQQAQSLQYVIRQYFKRWGEPKRFAIASGAIDFFGTPPDTFELFADVDGVGPMLRIQELPRDHPALGHEIASHWSREPIWCETSIARVAVTRSDLAGNFAICRADGGYRAPKTGLRVYHPFDARSLEWATSRAAKSLEQGFYYDVAADADGVLQTVTRPLWSNDRLNW